MADVGRPRGAPDRSPTRGQLFLVTALGLAILFVSLALVVNTVIFTENRATRSAELGITTDAQRFQEASLQSVAGTMAYANHHNNTSHAALNDELRRGVLAYQNVSQRLFATSDRSVSARVDSATNGSRVFQTDSDRNITATTGDRNWTVASDVRRTRQFEMNLSTDDLLDEGAGLGSQFTIVVTDGADRWRLYLYNDSSSTEVIVEVDPPAASGGSCSTPGVPRLALNLTDGSLAGQPCEYLSFGEGVGSGYSIAFENADRASGTYSLIVDNASLADSPGPHLNAPGGGQPTVAHAVYSTNVTLSYRTPRLRYEATIRIAPGEPA